MKSIGRHINMTLVRWARRKYKTLRRHKIKACKFMEKLATQAPYLFSHWRARLGTAFALWERYESRGSRTVLREAVGEDLAVYSPFWR